MVISAIAQLSCRCTCRYSVPYWGLVFYVLAFLGFVCSATFRESLTVAIVAMVNQTDRDTRGLSNDSDLYQCPRDPELEYEEGEFSWDRHEEALILSAYFYGRGLTQVCALGGGCKDGQGSGATPLPL